MGEIAADPKLVSRCGFYCGGCKSYLAGKCTGCDNSIRAGLCKARPCCMERELRGCADCKDYPDVTKCSKCYGLVPRIIGVLFNVNRPANIASIRAIGYEAHAEKLAGMKVQSLSRRG